MPAPASHDKKSENVSSVPRFPRFRVSLSSIGDGWAMAVVLHELVHNTTGRTDPDLQRSLGIEDSNAGGSVNITLKLAASCLF